MLLVLHTGCPCRAQHASPRLSGCPEAWGASALCVTAPTAGHSPLLAGDDPDLLALAMGCHEPGLPPLIVRGIDDVQDVPVGEAEALAGQATVPGPVIVKQSSVKEQRR